MDTMHGLAIAFGNKGGVGLTTDALWWYWVGLIYRSRLLALKEATRPPHWNHSSSLGLIVFTCGPTTELNQSKLHFIEASSNVRSRPKRWHLKQQNPGISSEAQKKNVYHAAKFDYESSPDVRLHSWRVNQAQLPLTETICPVGLQHWQHYCKYQHCTHILDWKTH